MPDRNEITDLKAGKPRIDYFMIPILQVMWVNFHPGAPFAFVLFSCAIIAAVAVFLLKDIDSLMPGISASTMRALGIAFFFTIIFTGINPYGFHGLTAPFEFAQNGVFLKYIAEWAPITLKEMISFHGPPGHLALPFFTIVGIIAFASGIRSRKINIFHVLVFGITAFMAFRSQRFIATFSLLTAPAAAAHLTPLLEKYLSKPVPKAIATFMIIAAISVTGYFYGPRNPRFIWGAGVNERFYPDRAIEFIRQNDFIGNMYNTYGLGGPLIWGLYPDHPVFVDGRVPVYGSDFYMDIIKFEGAPATDRWNEMQDLFGLTYAIIKRDRMATVDTILKGNGDWALVFWDSYSLVLAKNIPGNNNVIEKNRYFMITPYTALDSALKWKTLSAQERELLVSELRRNCEQNPRSIQSILSLAYISFVEGDHERALKMARHGLDIEPRQARLHGLLGEIYLNMNRKDLALTEFREASKLLPGAEEYKARIRDIKKK